MLVNRNEKIFTSKAKCVFDEIRFSTVDSLRLFRLVRRSSIGDLKELQLMVRSESDEAQRTGELVRHLGGLPPCFTMSGPYHEKIDVPAGHVVPNLHPLQLPFSFECVRS